MCIVSDTSLKELIIPKEEHEVAKKWFENEIGTRLKEDIN